MKRQCATRACDGQPGKRLKQTKVVQFEATSLRGKVTHIHNVSTTVQKAKPPNPARRRPPAGAPGSNIIEQRRPPNIAQTPGQDSPGTRVPEARRAPLSHERQERMAVLESICNENQNLRKLRGTLAAERMESMKRRRSIDELSSDMIILQGVLKTERQQNKLHEEKVAQQHEDLADLRNSSSVHKEKCKTLEEEVQSLQSQLQDALAKIQEELCGICCERKRKTVCMPCMHLHYCAECLQQHMKRRKTCPYCGIFVRGTMNVFT